MKTLLILRHAKSSWGDTSLSDHDRPLKKRGRQDAPRMGELLYHEDIVPDQILSSTARRAKETALAVAEASGYEGEIRFTRDLYHADIEDFISLLVGLSEQIQSVMIVSHNPGMEELLYHLTGESEWLPTAALAQVELPVQQWRELASDDIDGRLVNIWRPRDL